MRCHIKSVDKELMIANVFSIVGTDPIGGVGILADLKTFSAMETYGMETITAVVAQNTSGVRAFQTLDPKFVADQIDAVFDDVRVDVVKIGMVATADIAKAIADLLALGVVGSFKRRVLIREKYFGYFAWKR